MRDSIPGALLNPILWSTSTLCFTDNDIQFWHNHSRVVRARDNSRLCFSWLCIDLIFHSDVVGLDILPKHIQHPLLTIISSHHTLLSIIFRNSARHIHHGFVLATGYCTPPWSDIPCNLWIRSGRIIISSTRLEIIISLHSVVVVSPVLHIVIRSANLPLCTCIYYAASPLTLCNLTPSIHYRRRSQFDFFLRISRIRSFSNISDLVFSSISRAYD